MSDDADIVEDYREQKRAERKGDGMGGTKHTPGPWEYGRALNYEGFYIAPRGTRPTLAAAQFCHGKSVMITCHNFPGETEPNARLIAAAPDQNAALVEVEQILAFHEGSEEPANDSPTASSVVRINADDFHYLLTVIRRAIARATETPTS